MEWSPHNKFKIGVKSTIFLYVIFVADIISSTQPTLTDQNHDLSLANGSLHAGDIELHVLMSSAMTADDRLLWNSMTRTQRSIENDVKNIPNELGKRKPKLGKKSRKRRLKKFQPGLKLKIKLNRLTTNEGQAVQLQCHDEGPNHVPVRWVRPVGRPLPPNLRDVNGHLEIPSIRLEHSGEYICEAIGYPATAKGSKVSAYLTVEKHLSPAAYKKPTIQVTVSPPLIQTLTVGDTLRLNCSGTHLIRKIPINVIWHKRHGHLPDDSRVSKSRGSLIISNVQYNDSGTYACRGNVSGEIAQQYVTVTVEGDRPRPPQVTLSPTHINSFEGDSVDVDCQSTGAAPVVWERLHGQLSSDTKVNQGHLRFDAIRKSDEGDYRCTSRTNYGEDSKILHVYVSEEVIPPPPRPTAAKISPSHYNGLSGDEVRLFCSSQPGSRIDWTKSGQDALAYHISVIQNTLIIHEARVEDSGRYICTSYPNHGSPSSQSAEVVIESRSEPPQIKRFQGSYNIVQGQDFSLNCEASGNPYPKVKWTRVHESFEPNMNQKGNILRITDAQPSNRGVYTCIAESDGGTVEESVVIDIERREPPSLEIHPNEPQAVRVGEQTMIACRVVAGIPTPTVKWARRDGGPLSPRITEDHPGTLMFREVTLEEAGEYECKAENIVGKASVVITLNIQENPIVTLLPSSSEVTILEGSELRIECSATGIPLPAITWTTPSGNHQSSIDGRIYEPNVEERHAGTYICVAKNEAGSDEKNITVHVKKRDDSPSNPPPSSLQSAIRLTIEPLQPVVVGDTARLKCSGLDLIKNITINVFWHKRGGRIPQKAHQSRGELWIRNVVNDDSGIYACRANVKREVAENYVTLTVEDGSSRRPVVTLNPTNIELTEGESAEVTCQSSGAPSVNYIWDRSNEQMSKNFTFNQGILKMKFVQKSDEDTYRCTARNNYGEDSQIVTVHVREKHTPLPSYLPIVDINPACYDGFPGDEITLSCSSQTEGRFRWSKSGQDTLDKHISINDSLLTIHQARAEDAGRYICTLYPFKGVPSSQIAYVTVKSKSDPPQIGQFEDTYDVAKGQDFSLNCETSGNPNLKVKWVRGTTPLEANVNQNGSSLQIKNAQPLNSGVYSCVVDSDSGRAEKNTTIKVEQHEPPVLEIYPSEPQMVSIGKQAMLYCRAKVGIPKPSIKWKRRDQRPLSHRVSEDTSGVLIFRNVTAEESGDYVCEAQNSLGNASASAKVTVGERPVITLLPNSTSLTVTEGKELKIECSATGSKITWKTPSTSIVGGVINIPNATESHAGTYICVAESPSGKDEKSVTVLIKKREPPKIVFSKPMPLTVEYGDKVVIYCNATGTQPIKVHWHHQDIPPLKGSIISHGNELQFSYITTKNSGSYYCTAENDDGSATKEAIVTVNPPPGAVPIDSYKVALGDKTEMHCDIENRTTLWRRVDGHPLPSGTSSDNGILSINATSHDSAGFYECLIHDHGEEIPVIKTEIILIEPPRITFTPSMPMSVQYGDNVEIHCHATGKQPIKVHWHTEIAGVSSPLKGSIVAQGNGLKFTNITGSDAGRYYCTGENEDGTATRVAELAVEGK